MYQAHNPLESSRVWLILYTIYLRYCTLRPTRCVLLGVTTNPEEEEEEERDRNKTTQSSKQRDSHESVWLTDTESESNYTLITPKHQDSGS